MEDKKEEERIRKEMEERINKKLYIYHLLGDKIHKNSFSVCVFFSLYCKCMRDVICLHNYTK